MGYQELEVPLRTPFADDKYRDLLISPPWQRWFARLQMNADTNRRDIDDNASCGEFPGAIIGGGMDAIGGSTGVFGFQAGAGATALALPVGGFVRNEGVYIPSALAQGEMETFNISARQNTVATIRNQYTVPVIVLPGDTGVIRSGAPCMYFSRGDSIHHAGDFEGGATMKYM